MEFVRGVHCGAREQARAFLKPEKERASRGSGEACDFAWQLRHLQRGIPVAAALGGAASWRDGVLSQRTLLHHMHRGLQVE